ncbi:M60 family metallopeptidase [Chitinilyticum litopenaei]|uniref:M60 family metallopeptidase n=1 Tax=Chitinilyticum litopenaei TaxID=1121276 RepID=UPI00130E7B31|nr:M60 family metallopeptidase [Chitinilyticum litopenaei]
MTPRHALRAGALLSLLTAFNSHAADPCSPVWSSTSTYTEGQQASLQGSNYRAKWWTRGEEPGTTGQWGVWQLLGACTSGNQPSPTPQPSPLPTVRPSSTPTATPSATPTTAPSATATPQAGNGCLAAWSASVAYTGGQRASRLGRNYEAKWWTQGFDPSQAGPYDPWKDLGACGATTVTPTATATPKPSATPTAAPTAAPTATATPKPSATPTATATPKPSATPTATPTPVGSSLVPPRALTLEQPGDIGTLRAAQQRSFNHTPFQSTGYWVQTGDVLVVNYHYTGGAPNKGPEIWIHSIDDDTWGYSTAQKVKLNVGSTTITASKTGAVYVAAFNTPTDGELKVELVSGGRVMPRFVLGKHTAADWAQMLANYSDAPYGELVSQRMMLTATLPKVKQHVDDPVVLMTLWDEVVRLTDEQYGIKPGNAWPHNPTPHRFHYVELPPYDGWMYSWQYRMASASADGALRPVLNSKTLRTDGWGPWHELGHQYQMSTFTWADQTEVTVNLTSAYVQRALGNASRYETQGTWTKTFAYLAQPTRDFATQSDLFVRATMFWQLDLTFGQDFYAKLGTNYRNMPAALRPSTDAAEKQTFIIETSRVAGYDLTPFFEQWGIAVDAATRTTLGGMALKPLTQPIWQNRDSRVLYRL